MDEDLVRQWVPGELWELAAPLVPPVRPRPQGGGTAMTDPRAALAAIGSVLTTGCAWRHLPPGLEVVVPTAHRRFAARTGPGAGAGYIPLRWTSSVPRAWSTGRGRSAKRQCAGDKGGELTGPQPVDRGKLGSKLPVLSDRAGLPLAVAVSAAHPHDSQALQPLVRAIPAIRSHRRRPAKLHTDKGYDAAWTRAWLRQRGITPHIARRRVEDSTRLGCHRWRSKPLLAQLFGHRRTGHPLRTPRRPVLRVAHSRRHPHLP